MTSESAYGVVDLRVVIASVGLVGVVYKLWKWFRDQLPDRRMKVLDEIFYSTSLTYIRRCEEESLGHPAARFWEERLIKYVSLLT